MECRAGTKVRRSALDVDPGGSATWATLFWVEGGAGLKHAHCRATRSLQLQGQRRTGSRECGAVMCEFLGIPIRDGSCRYLTADCTKDRDDAIWLMPKTITLWS